MNYDSRAETLVSFSALVAPNCVDAACKIFPQLLSAERLELWGFFGTVLAVGTAIRKIKADVPEGDRDRLHRIVVQRLQEWNISGTAALDDLHMFTEMCAARSTGAIDLPDFYIGTGGTWVLWNVTDKKFISGEREIASMIGNFYVKGFDSFWTSPIYAYNTA
jgi:hypothetical protein